MEKTKFMAVGKDMGKYTQEENLETYAIVNNEKTFILFQPEYECWKLLRSITDIEEWSEKVSKEMSKTFVQMHLKNIYSKLSEVDLIHPWEFKNIKDKNLGKYIVIKNGDSIRYENDIYEILINEKAGYQKIEEKTYKIWNTAREGMRINDLITYYAKENGISLEESFEEIFENYGELMKIGALELIFEEK